MDEVDDAASSVRTVSLHRRPAPAALPPVRSAQDSASRADFAVFYGQQTPRLVGFVMRHGTNVHEAAEAAHAAVAQLKAEGHQIRKEGIARLSPLKHRNLNLLGRYSFTVSTPAAGVLRPLRNPAAPELDEDETGWE